MTEKRDTFKDVMSIYVPAFFIRTGMSIVSPVLSIYAKSFDVSYTLASLVISIYSVSRLISDLPVGVIGDRIGRRPTLLIGAILITVSAFLCAQAASFWELIFYRFLQGVGSSMWQTMRVTMLQDILKPEERGRILGYFQAFMLIGSSAGPTIGGLAAETWGIRAPFYVYSFGSLLCLILSYLLISETSVGHARQQNNSMAGKHHGEFSLRVIKRLFNNTTYFVACVVTLTISLMRQAIRNTLIPLYGSVELDLGEAEIGVAISIATLVNLLIVIPVGHAIDRFGRKMMLIRSLIAKAIVLGFFPFTQDFIQLSLVCAILGFSDCGGGQAALTMASDVTMDEPHGISMGLYRVFSDIGSIIGPLLVGTLIDSYGLRSPFYLVSVIVALTLLIVQLFAKETLPKKR